MNLSRCGSIGCVLVLFCTLTWAEESGEEIQLPETADAYDQALRRFNTHIQSYPSFEAFEAEVLSNVSPGRSGTCYEWTGEAFNPVKMAAVVFEGFDGEGWRKTSGQGWRQSRADRSFVEYRFAPKLGLLMRIEGVKPRFFFASTRRICEFAYEKSS